jgi:hypothetical protein
MAVKWILFAFFSSGAAPVTPEHHFGLTAEFEDRTTCEAVLHEVKEMRRPYRGIGFCAPKGIDGLKPEMREKFEKLWPLPQPKKD